MKTIVTLLMLLGFAGCQVPATGLKLPPAAVEPRPIALATTPKVSAPEDQKARQQVQLIEALMSQNDALLARVRELEHRAIAPAANLSATNVSPAPIAAPPPPEPIVTAPAPPSSPPPLPENAHWLRPNADGVIDLTAADTTGENASNPFAVRTSVGPVTETKLVVQGVLRGRETACAVINGRPVAVGDTVGPCRIVRIESDAVICAASGQLLRLPFSETRVRHG